MSIASLFGEPRTGIHSIRFLDLAIVDVALTAVAASLFTRYYATETSFLTSFVGWMLLSLVVHLLVGVDTRLVQLVKQLLVKR